MTDVNQTNDSGTQQGGTGAGASEGATADKFKNQFATLKSQASDTARDYADKGVGHATDALDQAARFLQDTARTVEEKLGPQYGKYGFSAAESVSGFAEQLRGKNVDELMEDARELVRKSPAIAIGAAVGVGFILARLAKAGAGYNEPEAAKSAGTKAANDSASTDPASPNFPA